MLPASPHSAPTGKKKSIASTRRAKLRPSLRAKSSAPSTPSPNPPTSSFAPPAAFLAICTNSGAPASPAAITWNTAIPAWATNLPAASAPPANRSAPPWSSSKLPTTTTSPATNPGGTSPSPKFPSANPSAPPAKNTRKRARRNAISFRKLISNRRTAIGPRNLFSSERGRRGNNHREPRNGNRRAAPPETCPRPLGSDLLRCHPHFPHRRCPSFRRSASSLARPRRHHIAPRHGRHVRHRRQFRPHGHCLPFLRLRLHLHQ